MGLIRLERLNGAPVWINPRQVAFLEHQGSLVTGVRFAFVAGAGEWPYQEQVRGHIDQVAAALNWDSDEDGPMDAAQRRGSSGYHKNPKAEPRRHPPPPGGGRRELAGEAQ